MPCPGSVFVYVKMLSYSAIIYFYRYSVASFISVQSFILQILYHKFYFCCLQERIVHPTSPTPRAKPSTYMTVADFEDTVGDGISFTAGESVTVSGAWFQWLYFNPFITSSEGRIYSWTLAVHSEYTAGHQQCIQSIQLETSSAFRVYSSAFRVYSWKPAMHSKHTAGNQQCVQSIQLDTSSAFRVYSWKPAVHSEYTAVHSEYTAGNQQCVQSIQLETSSAFKAYSWKPAVCSKYTAGNQQCVQSIQLETSSVFKVYIWKPTVCLKYTAGNQQCVQSIQLETSIAFKAYN